MGYKTVKYQTDAGTVVRIRVSDETIAAAGNAAPAGAVDDQKIFAFASNPGSKRKKALNARGLILGRTVGTAPDTAVKYTFLPIFTKAAMDGIEDGATYTLRDKAYTVRSRVDEA